MRTVPQLPAPGQGAPGAIVQVHIHGATYDVVQDHRGDVFVSVRRVCDVLGLTLQAQLVKLKGRPWACIAMIATQVGGQRRDVAFIGLDALPMWLATIEPSRVRPEHRERLIVHQREAARVLRDHFFGPRALPALPPSLPARRFPNLVTALGWTGVPEPVELIAWRMALAGDVDLTMEVWALVLADLSRTLARPALAA